MIAKLALLMMLSFIYCALHSQILKPDLQDSTQWKVVNRTVEPFVENGKKGIRFNEMPGDGLMILKGSNFTNGTIELDIKGNNKLQQSFVGFAFHEQGIETFEAVYFRPFNFKSQDEARRSHSVQYISMPAYDWEKLRNQFPGKYENKIDPPPGADDWFHAKIVVDGKMISVFVNHAQTPSLEVERIGANGKGGFGFWVGNNSGGSFANLAITETGK